MKRFVVAVVVALALASHVQAQDGVCPNEDRGDNCYFDGVASLPPSGSSANEYFVIGGLFDVHDKGDNAYSCKDEISDKAILNVLAFFWAVNSYGRDLTSRKGVSVGAFAFDNCYRPEQTIENLLGFSQCKLFLKGIRENVVAYVGPYGNEDTVRAGNLASSLFVTLVSPDANSYEFEEDQTAVLRVRPNFDYDLKAILGFLKLINSEHVIVVYSEESFYKDAFTSLMEMLESSDQKLCVHKQLSVTSMTDMDDLVVEQLEDQAAVRYLVPLMDGNHVQKLMTAVANNRKVNDRFINILSSNIGRNMEITTANTIVVEPAISISVSEFDNALKDIQRNATLFGNFGLPSLSNPWLNAYLDQTGKTQVPSLTDVNLPSDIRQSVSRTIAAVKHIVLGMELGIEECAQVSNRNFQVCDDLRNTRSSRNKISEAIIQEAGLEKSQLPASVINYDYYTYNSDRHQFLKIGTYNAKDNSAELNAETKNNPSFISEFTPSICPDDNGCCVEPTTPAMTEEPTTPMATTPQSPTLGPKRNTIEVEYPIGKEITGAYSYDDDVDRKYETRFDDGHKWIIALCVLAGLGILCVLVFEIYIMYKLMGTRMGSKWRTMWLGQLLLFGVFLAYLTAIAFIFVPTDATCGIIRFGVGLSYAICFSVLLVKLMVILTSKSSDVLLPGDGDSPNYLKGVYQFLMFIFAVCVQVVINVQWLITIPPEAIRVMSRSGEQVWVCNHYTWETGKNMFMMGDFVRTNFENHLLSLVYIMFLILITTILSLKAHGIITNHRESVFIGIASGFSIPIWLAWGLVGGLNKDHDYAHEFGDACMAFGLVITVTLIMFAMFLPKVRQLVNMGVEGIYLEDDRDTYYAGSVIMAPPSSYKGRGNSNSVIYVNNQGFYSEPVVIGNGDPSKAHDGGNHLKHPGSHYSAPPAFIKKSKSTYGGSQVLRMTDDLKGHHPQKKTQSEVNYGNSIKSRSYKGTLPRSRSQSDLGAL